MTLCFLSSVHSVTIKFKVLEAGNVTINVYDLSGKKVRLLVDDIFQPGDYEIRWNGMNDIGKRVAQGIYFCAFNMKSGADKQIKKLVLL